MIAHPRALGLGERHDRAERLQQADEVEAGDVGVEDAPEQLDVVVGRGEQVVVEEGEGDLVAGAVDDDVGVRLAAVGEAHAIALERGDVRLRRDRAVRDAVEDAPETVGWASPNLWSGLGRP